MRYFTVDFETTTDPNDCRVWFCGVCDIYNTDFKIWFKTVNEWLDFIQEYDGCKCYFHNLKFDGEFIIQELFKQGWNHNPNLRALKVHEFNTLISDKGQFYSMYIKFPNSRIVIYDSLKILPMSVAEMADAFNLPIQKLTMDYDAFRPVGYEPSLDEIAYLYNDIEIPARALRTLFDQGLNKMTQGSNALSDYKQIVGKKRFKRDFPIPDYDHDIRQSYKGGFTYVNPRFQKFRNWGRDSIRCEQLVS